MDTPSTRLSAADRMRFARQVSLDEIGEAGQARLCLARARVGTSVDSSRGADRAEVAALYLQRAGVRVERSNASSGGEPVDAVIAAQSELEPERLARAGDPRLAHAAAWLRGSFEAVEAIKALLGVGVAARVPEGALTPELAEQEP